MIGDLFSKIEEYIGRRSMRAIIWVVLVCGFIWLFDKTSGNLSSLINTWRPLLADPNMQNVLLAIAVVLSLTLVSLFIIQIVWQFRIDGRIKDTQGRMETHKVDMRKLLADVQREKDEKDRIIMEDMDRIERKSDALAKLLRSLQDLTNTPSSAATRDDISKKED